VNYVLSDEVPGNSVFCHLHAMKISEKSEKIMSTVRLNRRIICRLVGMWSNCH